MRTVIIISLSAFGGFAADAALAHHSAGAYDLTRSTTATVQLTRFVWENPHIYFDFAVKNPNGTAEKWHLEAGPPIMFLRGGVKRSDFEKGVGKTVEMTWCSTRNGATYEGAKLGYWHATKFPDGSEIVEQDVLKQPRPPPGHC